MVHGFQSNSSSFAAPHEFLQRILEFNRSQNWFTQQRLHKKPLSSMIERHGFLMFLAICPKISLKPSHFLHMFCIFCWQELTSFSRQMDMLLPLVMAAWRCKLVRDAAVIFLGLVLLLLGQDLSMRDSSEWLVSCPKFAQNTWVDVFWCPIRQV